MINILLFFDVDVDGCSVESSWLLTLILLLWLFSCLCSFFCCCCLWWWINLLLVVSLFWDELVLAEIFFELDDFWSELLFDAVLFDGGGGGRLLLLAIDGLDWIVRVASSVSKLVVVFWNMREKVNYMNSSWVYFFFWVLLLIYQKNIMILNRSALLCQ